MEEEKFQILVKKKRVGIKDTDATGRLFCPRPIEWIIELFEESCFYQVNKGQDVAIVKASVEHFLPLGWLKPYEIHLAVDWIKNRSFQIKGTIFSDSSKAVEVQLILVVNESAGDFLKMCWPLI
jgi:hypothetical protein